MDGVLAAHRQALHIRPVERGASVGIIRLLGLAERASGESDAAATSIVDEITAQREVLHPYLGYVFNEVALPWVDNYRQDVSPLYPRSWKQRVETIPDPRGQHLLGRLVCVRDHRVALARFVSGSPLELSVSANLVWKALDRLEASRMARAETALAEYHPQGSRYRWQGPASDPPGPRTE